MASNESARIVYSWDGSSWVQQFTYVNLAGSHMDGLEVVRLPVVLLPFVEHLHALIGQLEAGEAKLFVEW